MFSTRSRLAAAAVAALLATGCGSDGGDDSSPDETPASTASAICSEFCSDKEVTETGCDKRAVDAIVAKPVRISAGLHGRLGLRKSNPAVCSGIYWARFTPDADSTEAFQVTITVAGKAAVPQPSEPGNPALEAWTVGVHAKPGESILACVVHADGKQSVCLDDTKAA